MAALLEVKNLKKHFNTPKGKLHACDGVSFKIQKGKTLGIVGESGCGKSTTGRLITRLHDITDGEIFFEGKNVSKLSNKEYNADFRKQIQMIFQDPLASLNPRKNVFKIVSEPYVVQFKKTEYKELKAKGKVTCSYKEFVKQKVVAILEKVGISHRVMGSYPHELDGGTRQRVGIARALILEPKFIVCDEPTSALDVSVQAHALNLLNQLQKELNLTYIFITHDLAVVKYVSDDIMVMYLGQAVEKASSDNLFKNRFHPYTQSLLSAIPEPDPNKKLSPDLAEGELSSPINPTPGCRFAPRCRHAEDVCKLSDPVLREIKKDHFVACHLLDANGKIKKSTPAATKKTTKK